LALNLIHSFTNVTNYPISIPLVTEQLELLSRTDSVSKLDDILKYLEKTSNCNVIIYGQAYSGKTELVKILSQFIPGKTIILTPFPKEFLTNPILDSKTRLITSGDEDCSINTIIYDEINRNLVSELRSIEFQVSLFTTQNIQRFIHTNQKFFDSPSTDNDTILVCTDKSKLISKVIPFDENLVDQLNYHLNEFEKSKVY